MNPPPKLYALAVDALKGYLDQTHWKDQSLEGLLSVEDSNFSSWRSDGFNDWAEVRAALKLAWARLVGGDQ